MKKAKFLLLSHGRVATASLLEGFQYVPRLFVPSYWHSDEALISGDLSKFFNYDGRYSAQIKFPIEMPGIDLGLINHNFPIQRVDFVKISNRIELFLDKKASVFVYNRNFKDNILSSYRAYLVTWFCFQYSNKKLIPPSSFNTLNPLNLKEFLAKYDVIADTSFQLEIYEKLGYKVFRREFENLNYLDFEIKYILKSSDIEFPENLAIPKIEYKSKDNWPVQTAFAFHNNFIINGKPLSVGFFSPFRRHPNQGTLTHRIHDGVYVGLDQWFLIPEKYKEAIISCNDPWEVVNKTKENFIIYEAAVMESANQLYKSEVTVEIENRLLDISRPD